MNALTIAQQQTERTLAEWRAAGLVPVEVTPEQLTQTIRVKHNALTGEFEWKVEGLDGVQALGLMADALFDMLKYFLQSPVRPKLNSGDARVAVWLEGDRLRLAQSETVDRVVLQGLLMAALLQVSDPQTPLESLLNGIELPR